MAEEEADDALLEEALAEVDEQRLALRRLHHLAIFALVRHRAPTAASRSDGFLSAADVTCSAAEPKSSQRGAQRCPRGRRRRSPLRNFTGAPPRPAARRADPPTPRARAPVRRAHRALPPQLRAQRFSVQRYNCSSATMAAVALRRMRSSGNIPPIAIASSVHRGASIALGAFCLSLGAAWAWQPCIVRRRRRRPTLPVRRPPRRRR